MNPNPLSSLNHLTVPVAMLASSLVACRVRGASLEATTCERLHCLAGDSPARSSRTVAAGRARDLAGGGPRRVYPRRRALGSGALSPGLPAIHREGREERT